MASSCAKHIEDDSHYQSGRCPDWIKINGAPGDRARDADCFEQTQFTITVVKNDPPPEAFNGWQPHKGGFCVFS